MCIRDRFQRVRLASQGRVAELGRLDAEWGCGEPRWQRALDAYFEAHGQIAIDADARSAAFLSIDEADEQAEHVWHVRQIFSDPEGDHDFAIQADVDLDATQEAVSYTHLDVYKRQLVSQGVLGV